jgi:hypothetical protein
LQFRERSFKSINSPKVKKRECELKLQGGRWHPSFLIPFLHRQLGALSRSKRESDRHFPLSQRGSFFLLSFSQSPSFKHIACACTSPLTLVHTQGKTPTTPKGGSHINTRGKKGGHNFGHPSSHAHNRYGRLQLHDHYIIRTHTPLLIV